MKLSNLKRFMASLLAVVMLFSVVGISPAVFAEEADAATQSIAVQAATETSTVVLKRNASIAYNMSAAAEAEAIVANVINYDESILPAGTTADNFTVQVKRGLLYKDVSDHQLKAEKSYDIRVKYNGNDTYKESDWAKVSISVTKAAINLTVNPVNTIYAGKEIDRSTVYTVEPNDPAIDVYMFFVGVNTNKETCVYLKLSADQEKLINAISDAQAAWNDFWNVKDGVTLKEKLQKGTTVGEFRKILNNIATSDIAMGIIKAAGYDADAVKAIIEAFDRVASISDDTVLAIGTPAHAGVYTLTAVAVGKNYETTDATGSLIVLKNWKGIKLAKNPVLSSNAKANTITVSQAEALKEGNNLCILTEKGTPLNSASAGSIRYWFTGVGKIYAKSTMPTAPGKYIVTASVSGGDFFAFPYTFTFTIVAD